jgi:hypothetical protein
MSENEEGSTLVISIKSNCCLKNGNNKKVLTIKDSNDVKFLINLLESVVNDNKNILEE